LEGQAGRLENVVKKIVNRLESELRVETPSQLELISTSGRQSSTFITFRMLCSGTHSCGSCLFRGRCRPEAPRPHIGRRGVEKVHRHDECQFFQGLAPPLGIHSQALQGACGLQPQALDRIGLACEDLLEVRSVWLRQ